MAMTNINKVPDADTIAKRISDITSLGDIEMEMVTKVLNDWNEEWIGFIAENKTGKTDNTEQTRKRDNAKRLRDRINKIGGPINEPNMKAAVFDFDNVGF